MTKKKVTAKVLSQKKIGPDIYDLWMSTELAETARPGQFVCVYPKDKSALLGRPISICEVIPTESMMRLVYRKVGKGTSEFATLNTGDNVELLGNLGNGFPAGDLKMKKFLKAAWVFLPWCSLPRLFREKSRLLSATATVKLFWTRIWTEEGIYTLLRRTAVWAPKEMSWMPSGKTSLPPT